MLSLQTVNQLIFIIAGTCLTFITLNNIEMIFAQEDIKNINFYTIYIKSEGNETKIVDVSHFSLNGTDTQIRENYPIDEVFALEQKYKPPYHLFETSNGTITVYNATKEDYMDELDRILQDREVIKASAADNCWTIDIRGGHPPSHSRC